MFAVTNTGWEELFAVIASLPDCPSVCHKFFVLLRQLSVRFKTFKTTP